MTKKIIKEDNYDFTDNVSGISYRWLKEETEQVNGISCWSAKDQWGCKDYFVVKEGLIIRGPYKTIKETCEALERDDYEDSESDILDEISKDDNGYVKAGFIDELHQAVNQVTEVIRRCNELICRSDEVGKQDLVAVLDKIVETENSNIGMIQAMLKSLTDTSGAIDSGEEEAEKIMQDASDEYEDVVFDDIDIEPEEIDMDILKTTPPVGETDNVAKIIAGRYNLDQGDDFDDDVLGF